MMLTNERAAELSKYLSEDVERAKLLLSLEPEQALEKINADGNDFTIEELKAYGEIIKTASSQGELNVEDLEDVSGGCAVHIAFGLGYLRGKYGW